MKIIAALKAGCLLAMALALTSALAASKKEVDEMMSGDGLQKISVKGIDLAYARPDATLAAYKRVKLDAVEVELSKSWDPVKTGSRMKRSTQERENIRAGIALRKRQLLARVADRREANGGTRMQISNSVVNEGEARTIAAAWAHILRKALDKAHGIDTAMPEPP